MVERVELAQVIGQLRRELSVAMREGEGEDLRFELGPVELELTVGVSKEAGPNAKVRFWVIEWARTPPCRRRRRNGSR
jgi:hypothetical protein